MMIHPSITSKESHKLFRPLLGIPVFYKVLFANSLIIFIGATGGTWLASNLHNSRQTLATPTFRSRWLAGQRSAQLCRPADRLPTADGPGKGDASRTGGGALLTSAADRS